MEHVPEQHVASLVWVWIVILVFDLYGPCTRTCRYSSMCCSRHNWRWDGMGRSHSLVFGFGANGDGSVPKAPLIQVDLVPKNLGDGLVPYLWCLVYLPMVGLSSWSRLSSWIVAAKLLLSSTELAAPWFLPFLVWAEPTLGLSYRGEWQEDEKKNKKRNS